MTVWKIMMNRANDHLFCRASSGSWPGCSLILGLTVLILALASVGTLGADPVASPAPRQEPTVTPEEIGRLIDETEQRCRSTVAPIDTDQLRAQVESAADDTERRQRLLRLAAALVGTQDYQQAVDAYDQALVIATRQGDRWSQFEIHKLRGRALRGASRNREALESYRKAEALVNKSADPSKWIGVTASIASIQELRGRYAEALGGYGAALAALSNSGDSGNAFLAANLQTDIALVHAELGNYEESRRGFDRALSLEDGILDVTQKARLRGRGLQNYGIALTLAGDHQGAAERYKEALGSQLPACDLTGAAGTINSLGFSLTQIGECASAMAYLDQALALSRRTRDRFGEARALDSIGKAQLCLNDTDRALGHLLESLTIAQDIDDRGGQYQTLLHLADVYRAKAKPRLEIVYLKRSVHILEDIRAENGGLPDGVRKGFDRSVEQSYRRLAQLFFADGRAEEARQVIELIEREQIDSASKRPDDRNTGADCPGLDCKPAAVLPLNAQEQQIWSEQQEQLSKALNQGRHLRTLEERNKAACRDAPPQDAAGCDALKRELVAARQAQREILRQFAKIEAIPAVVQALSKEPDAVPLTYLRTLMDRLPPHAVLLYPLLLPDELVWILTTRDLYVTYSIDGLQSNEVAAWIADFRNRLRDPRSDPKPAARRLYDRLFAPIRDAVDSDDVETIVYVPDGALRYVPLGALYDGKHWLAEDFAIFTITGNSGPNLGQARAPFDSILAAAFETRSYDVDINSEHYRFDPLVGAGDEVDAIARRFGSRVKRLPPAAFTQGIVDELRDYRLVHLATHALFRVGADDAGSFVLFGDGSRVTISDIKEWYLSGVDLFVLSACETGVGGTVMGDSTGREILGFGHAVQEAGAKTVMASLWKVSDGGTRALMERFYAALQRGQAPAQALQEAQRCLIRNDCQAGETATSPARGAVAIHPGAALPGFTALQHPYYWAPFFIIGNGG